jgi:bacillithiol synthase
VTGLVHPQPIGGRALVRDYLLEAPTALSFLRSSPFRLASFRTKLDDVAARFDRAGRERAAAALRPTSALAAQRLDRFVREGGAMVTTGQQTGFLTGPLYTIYKALSAVALARHLESRLGVLVLPVFWCASEDHDWDEVNHVVVLNPRGRARRFVLPGDDPRPLPMSERVLVGDLDELCDDIIQYIAPQGNNRSCLKSLLHPYRAAGRTVAQAFGDAVAALLGSRDLLLTDAADPALKEASKTVLRSALIDAAAHEEALRERTGELEGAGYGGQVAVLAGGTNLFLHGDEGRQRVYRRGSDFVIRERRGVLERDGLLSRLEAEPRRFSPNVLLRPVVESAVFPTLAYVGGPGEIGYFGQVGALFERLAMRPPVVVPRYAGLILERSSERRLKRLRLEPEELAAGRDVLRERLARRELPPSAVSMLESLRARLIDGYERLIGEVEGIDSTLARSLGSIRDRGLLDAHRAERKIVRAVKRGDAIRQVQLERVLDTLRPAGQPQDRVLNVSPFLARHGCVLLDEIEGAIKSSWRLPE